MPGDAADVRQPPGAGEEDGTASPAAHPAGNLWISAHRPRLPKSRAVSYERCINQVSCPRASYVLQTVPAAGRRCVGDAGGAPRGTDTCAVMEAPCPASQKLCAKPHLREGRSRPDPGSRQGSWCRNNVSAAEGDWLPAGKHLCRLPAGTKARLLEGVGAGRGRWRLPCKHVSVLCPPS